MSKLFQKGIVSIAISVVAVVGAGSLAGAINENNTPVSDDTSSVRDDKTHRLKLEERLKEKAADRESKMKERMKTKCEQHKSHLDKLVKNVQNRSQRVYDRITKINELIKKFYVKKELDVQEYDTLVADIDAKRALAKEHLDILLSSPRIDCDAASPRTMVKDFRNDRKDKINAMKAYRESVRKLLQVVRQAAIDQLSSRQDAKEGER